MLMQYNFNCKSCGYTNELIQGSYYLPFDSMGKLWAYKMFICNDCGRAESRYVPSVGRFNCRCHACNAPMKSVRMVNDLKNMPCPECEHGVLEIKGRMVRSALPVFMESA